ncbi:hypothetical protein AX769_20800 (plasmid) [Frondihabitans sp. PAMC 28766]|uniref:hypothetical protein n=1 Tax=Frondihabitans sp. PAMC 28766 TaxID=1795630 RepID=UPI00078D9A91|nr:hypothetical protein [Frondihabitans sp. PAMC 28766]AMM22588.1 hypothetical protein AX769_20800 [Frondihabitans sp. PAMC 28766]
MARSNLGAYQTMVELAKAANGPVRLGLYVAAGGTLIGGVIGAAAGPAMKKGATRAFVAAKERMRPASIVVPPTFTIATGADGGNKLRLHAGDKFHVLSEVEGGALIEVVGNKKNPWLVSSELLTTVSDFIVGER